MSVGQGELQNPERGQATRNPEQGQRPLEQRRPNGQEQRPAGPEAPPAPEPDERELERRREQAAKAELKAARERVAEARKVEPAPEHLHWRERWDAGRQAACDAFEAAAGTLRQRIVAGRSVQPEEGAGCRDCFEHGRDAALRVIEGR